MTRAIYGIASSSYHLMRVLSSSSEKTDDEQTKLAIRVTFYVDDYIGGADTEEVSIRTRQSITETLG